MDYGINFFHPLDHVEERLVLVQPHVVVGHRHFLEGHRFGVFEIRVWTPNFLENKLQNQINYLITIFFSLFLNLNLDSKFPAKQIRKPNYILN